MVNSNGMRRYDAVVIGSGQGGTPLSRYLAERGSKTALIEKTHVGGTCINEGCTPTKTMIASAGVAYIAQRAEDFGVYSEEIEVRLDEVRQRKRDIVNSFREGNLTRVENQDNLDLLRGTASFKNPNVLQIEVSEGPSYEIQTNKIFIDTGTRPSLPPIPGLESVDHLNSTSIMELDEVPDSLLIVGGGYVGVEFGQMFRRFGSNVKIFQRGSQILSREDEDVARELTKILEEDGIKIETGREVRRVEQPGEEEFLITIEKSGREVIEKGTHLLMATGRVPNTDQLKLENTEIQTDDRGYIKVDDKLKTTQDGVYALGDVKGGPAFTHISYDDFRIIRDNLFQSGSRSTKDRPVPYAVFTDPQLGRIGLTEKEAKDRGYEVRVAKMPMESVARALELDRSRGLMKAIVDGETDRILGAAILGTEGGEIASMIQVAMMGKLTYQELKDGVFAHPTLAESLNNLFSTL